MIFPNHQYVEIEENHWGNAYIADIVAVLESAIESLEPFLDLTRLPQKNLFIQNVTRHIPPLTHPKFYKEPITNKIFLSSHDMFWAQYIYQFAHEFCHHIMDCDYDPNNDQHGWIEETFAELASIFVLKEASLRWASNPPYPNWRNFSGALRSYSDDKIREFRAKINQPFKVWYTTQRIKLLSSRYNRDENGVIAIEILNILNTNPNLWKIIQYYNEIHNKQALCSTQLLDVWRILLPNTLQTSFDVFADLFK